MEEIYCLIDETLLNLSNHMPHGDQLRFDYDNPYREVAIAKMKKYDLVDFKIPTKPFQCVTHITENGLEALSVGSKAWIDNYEAAQLKKHTVNINSGNRFGDRNILNQSFNKDLAQPTVQNTTNDTPAKKSITERVSWIVGIIVGSASIIAYLLKLYSEYKK